MLKIDAEGHDLDVLRGGVAAIQRLLAGDPGGDLDRRR